VRRNRNSSGPVRLRKVKFSFLPLKSIVFSRGIVN
jgi:hypothetical protein